MKKPILATALTAVAVAAATPTVAKADWIKVAGAVVWHLVRVNDDNTRDLVSYDRNGYWTMRFNCKFPFFAEVFPNEVFPKGNPDREIWPIVRDTVSEALFQYACQGS